MLAVRVRKEMPGGFTLDVEFKAPAGVTIIFGASGSGKSLTLRAVAGLLRPDAGSIAAGDLTLFDSEAGVDLPPRRRRAGYVFQNLALFPHLTARQNVEFALPRLPRAEREARALGLLERFHVGHVAPRRPRDISGGEAQRVALARALATGPRVLLLDEPLSALDEATKLGIISDLKSFNRELRLPVLYVTHSRDEALALGERAVVYERGRVTAAGPPSEVFDAPVTSSVARLAGVENVFEGTVRRRDEAAGTMLVALGGARGDGRSRGGEQGERVEQGGAGDEGECLIEAPLGESRAGEPVCLAVRSGDILLAASEPAGLSARNVLRGRVRSVEQRGGQLLVRVRAGVEWAASVTRQSAEELGIEAGREVWLVFKTHSCRLFDAR
ncbi:MAG TPA: ATP-binding cassette domain-containing protein [Pyrinomonadaceae bacterium]|nr:ATP-binding cassette domain-containing protein [Pyrinomonadaceae bacterium]